METIHRFAITERAAAWLYQKGPSLFRNLRSTGHIRAAWLYAGKDKSSRRRVYDRDQLDRRFAAELDALDSGEMAFRHALLVDSTLPQFVTSRGATVWTLTDIMPHVADGDGNALNDWPRRKEPKK